MSKSLFIFRLALVASMFITGYFLFSRLPAQIPIHWNFEGVADGFGDKNIHVWLMPGIALLITFLFPFIKKFDPKRENYEKFSSAWEAIQTGIVGFFAYMYFLSLFISLPEYSSGVNVSFAMMLGVGILFIILGNFMGKIRKNYMVGFRLPWTIENEEVWNKTHRFGGKCMVFAGFLLALNAWFKIFPLAIFIISISLMSVIPMIYSYLVFRKLQK